LETLTDNNIDTFYRLTIFSQRAGKVFEVAEFLNDLEKAHNSIYLLCTPIFSKQTFEDYAKISRVDWITKKWRYTLYSPRTRDLIPEASQLAVKRISINSPGFWEFTGALNPLEQIRKYLCEKHERIKDNTWRNKTESEKAELENQLIRMNILREYNSIISEKIKIMKDAGVEQPFIDEFIRINLFRPLTELGTHQVNGLIGDANSTG
jgi:hypothetical protein